MCHDYCDAEPQLFITSYEGPVAFTPVARALGNGTVTTFLTTGFEPQSSSCKVNVLSLCHHRCVTNILFFEVARASRHKGKEARSILAGRRLCCSMDWVRSRMILESTRQRNKERKMEIFTHKLSGIVKERLEKAKRKTRNEHEKAWSKYQRMSTKLKELNKQVTDNMGSELSKRRRAEQLRQMKKDILAGHEPISFCKGASSWKKKISDTSMFQGRSQRVFTWNTPTHREMCHWATAQTSWIWIYQKF